MSLLIKKSVDLSSNQPSYSSSMSSETDEDAVAAMEESAHANGDDETRRLYAKMKHDKLRVPVSCEL